MSQANIIIISLLGLGAILLLINLLRKKNDKDSFWKDVFTSNKDFDSTMTLGGIVLAYLGLAIAIAVVAIVQDKVPQGLNDVFQHSKELMLLVAGYFFRKAQEKSNGGNQ